MLAAALAFAAAGAGAPSVGRIVEYGTCLRLSGTVTAGLARVAVERSWPDQPRPYTAVRDRAWEVVDAPPIATAYVVTSRANAIVARPAVRVRPRLSLARVSARPLTLQITVGAPRPLARGRLAVERQRRGRWRVERRLSLGRGLIVRYRVQGSERLRVRLDPGAGYVAAVTRAVAPARVPAAKPPRRARGTSLSEVVAALRGGGLPMCRATTVDPGLFGVPGQVFVNPAGIAEAFEFRTATDATAGARRVSRDGSTITTPAGALHRDVLAPERWFRAGRVLVHDIGPSPTSLAAFRAVLGSPFAGR